MGAVVYLSFLGDEKETREVLQSAKKWAKQGPVIILEDYNTGAAINRQQVEASVENRGRAGQHNEEGYENR